MLRFHVPMLLSAANKPMADTAIRRTVFKTVVLMPSHLLYPFLQRNAECVAPFGYGWGDVITFRSRLSGQLQQSAPTSQLQQVSFDVSASLCYRRGTLARLAVLTSL